MPVKVGIMPMKVTAMPVKVSESDAIESGNYANESESDSYASESQWKWGQWHLSKVWRQPQFADQPEAPAMRSQNANDILQMEIWGNLQILVFVNWEM